MWCDAQRRVEERCDAPRRVTLPTGDVDKSYASHRRRQHGAVARRLQDSAAAISRVSSAYDAIPWCDRAQEAATAVTRSDKTM